MGLAEDLDFLAAVGAGQPGVVLDDADEGDVHQLRQAHGLGDDHGDQVLGGGDQDDAVDGQYKILSKTALASVPSRYASSIILTKLL